MLNTNIILTLKKSNLIYTQLTVFFFLFCICQILRKQCFEGFLKDFAVNFVWAAFLRMVLGDFGHKLHVSAVFYSPLCGGHYEI